MSVELDLQIALSTGAASVPDASLVGRWVDCCVDDGAELTVRIVDEEEIADLNQTYRGKRGSTNVLSFPFEAPSQVDLPLLGDIVICAEVVRREAAEQGKPVEAHWAHMVVHGSLHLLGHDHVDEDDARRMETLESTILRKLGYADPWEGPIQDTRDKMQGGS